MNVSRELQCFKLSQKWRTIYCSVRISVSCLGLYRDSALCHFARSRQRFVKKNMEDEVVTFQEVTPPPPPPPAPPPSKKKNHSLPKQSIRSQQRFPEDKDTQKRARGWHLLPCYQHLSLHSGTVVIYRVPRIISGNQMIADADCGGIIRSTIQCAR